MKMKKLKNAKFFLRCSEKVKANYCVRVKRRIHTSRLKKHCQLTKTYSLLGLDPSMSSMLFGLEVAFLFLAVPFAEVPAECFIF